MNLNLDWFRSINDLALRNETLDKFMMFCSKGVPYIFALFVVGIYIAGAIKKKESLREMAVNTVIFSIINLAINMAIGIFIYEPRPFVSHKVNLLYPHAADSGFPSDHSSFTMSVSVGFGMFDKILGAIFMLMTILVGISRVYVGHHYPFDVITAYIIVFISGFFYNKYLKNRVSKLYIFLESKVISIIRK